MKTGDRVVVRVLVDGGHAYKHGEIAHVHENLERTIEVKLDDFWISSDVVRVHPDDVIKAEHSDGRDRYLINGFSVVLPAGSVVEDVRSAGGAFEMLWFEPGNGHHKVSLFRPTPPRSA